MNFIWIWTFLLLFCYFANICFFYCYTFFVIVHIPSNNCQIMEIPEFILLKDWILRNWTTEKRTHASSHFGYNRWVQRLPHNTRTKHQQQQQQQIFLFTSVLCFIEQFIFSLPFFCAIIISFVSLKQLFSDIQFNAIHCSNSILLYSFVRF